jgi:hypothetical protein
MNFYNRDEESIVCLWSLEEVLIIGYLKNSFDKKQLCTASAFHLIK